MDLRASTELPAAPRDVDAVVADLATYPRWLGIVASATPTADATWDVVLQARLGPLRRTKRVRMVRTAHDSGALARFERRELDDREHSAWVLEARIDATRGGSRLTMHLHYGGAPSLPLLDQVLATEVRSAGRRLARLLASGDD